LLRCPGTVVSDALKTSYWPRGFLNDIVEIGNGDAGRRETLLASFVDHNPTKVLFVGF
jgi:hypothetical protein